MANADGTSGLDVRAETGLRFGFVTPLGVALLLAASTAVVAVVVRTRRERAGHDALTGA